MLFMKPISIYIHWPFCLSLCPYCDFNSHIADTVDHDMWLKSYERELSYFADRIKNRVVKSIFFGGGTPSLMSPKTVKGIISKISSLALIDKNTEISLEANPTSYEAQKFKQFKNAGINRVSIGVQSLQDDRLKFLGRKHSAANALAAVKSASCLFDRFSLDLIYASPNQTLALWQEELKGALDIAGGHISLYQLTIEKGTPFFKLHKDKHFILPDDDASADMYEWTNEYLKENNYKRYEISNYALEGNECIHNLSYWNYDEYIGIGPGAHSRLHDDAKVTALMMTHKPQKWLAQVKETGNGIQTQNVLSKTQVNEEIIMMGTRLEDGISEQSFYDKTKLQFKDILNQDIMDNYRRQNLINNYPNNLSLTSKGLLLHSYIVPRILM